MVLTKLCKSNVSNIDKLNISLYKYKKLNNVCKNLTRQSLDKNNILNKVYSYSDLTQLNDMCKNLTKQSLDKYNNFFINKRKLFYKTLNINHKNDILQNTEKYNKIHSDNNKIIDGRNENKSITTDKIDKYNTVHSDNGDLVIDDRKENKSIITDKINKYNEKIYYLKENNIQISTITVDCKLNTEVMLDNFAKYVTLSENKIVSVKFGNRVDPATNRTIVSIKKKKKSSNKNFYNQVTILMKPTNNLLHNYINIKVFKNGSLHMTGVKDMSDYQNVSTTLIQILKQGTKIKQKNNKLKPIKSIKYISNTDNVEISNTKIRMINSNFKVDFKIDRKKLFQLLKKYHDVDTKDTFIGCVEAVYNPNCGHSCVNIKHFIDDLHKPSIFVFQTGAIIITGAKSIDNIISSYKYIIKILSVYYNKIRIPDIDPILFKNLEAQYYKEKRAAKLLCK